MLLLKGVGSREGIRLSALKSLITTVATTIVRSALLLVLVIILGGNKVVVVVGNTIWGLGRCSSSSKVVAVGVVETILRRVTKKSRIIVIHTAHFVVLNCSRV